MVQPTQTDSLSVDGIKNWLIVMVFIFILKLVLENYLSYGIVVPPLQIAMDLSDLIIGKWWISLLICVCCCQQMLHMFLIEKSIISNLVSEKMGMTLHALNSFFVGFCCSLIAYLIDNSQLTVKIWMCYVMFTFTKSWSFAFVNMTARRRQQKERSENVVGIENTATETVVYPYNVNLENIITYMVFTPPLEYHFKFKRTEKRNISILPIAIVKILIIYYSVTFIAYQYLYPELQKTSLHISQGNYLLLAESILKMILPVNVGWLLYYWVLGFQIYLPAYSEIVGMGGIIYQSDWWNAANMPQYWPKWNVPMFICFKKNVVEPLLSMGYSKNTATAVVVMISGIMHEISTAHPLLAFNGLVFLGFVLQVPTGYVNVWIAKRYGKACGNLFLWLSLCLSHTLLTVFVVYSSSKNF